VFDFPGRGANPITKLTVRPTFFSDIWKISEPTIFVVKKFFALRFNQEEGDGFGLGEL